MIYTYRFADHSCTIGTAFDPTVDVLNHPEWQGKNSTGFLVKFNMPIKTDGGIVFGYDPDVDERLHDKPEFKAAVIAALDRKVQNDPFCNIYIPPTKVSVEAKEYEALKEKVKRLDAELEDAKAKLDDEEVVFDSEAESKIKRKKKKEE